MATLTITTTSAQDARIVKAFGSYLNLGRNATASEVKTHLIGRLKQIVHDQERLIAVAAAEATLTDIEPS